MSSLLLLLDILALTQSLAAIEVPQRLYSQHLNVNEEQFQVSVDAAQQWRSHKCHLNFFRLSRNHCAYVVQKNITCIMQDGGSTYVKAEYTTKCIWGQKCPVVMWVNDITQQNPIFKTNKFTCTYCKTEMRNSVDRNLGQCCPLVFRWRHVCVNDKFLSSHNWI